MDVLNLSKVQFFLTIGFHFIFTPITIGLAWFIVYFMYKYLKTDDIYYKQTAWFWIKLLAVTVGIGVPTGIIMEFQFGTNWAEYSRFVGEIFGTMLSLEIFFAFFLESVWLGFLLASWYNQSISDKVRFIAVILVAIGATLSAFFILVANSWMHTPAGYAIDPTTNKIIVTDFWKAVFNPSTIPRFAHTLNASILTASFFMMGISAIYIVKKKNIRFAKESFTVPLLVAMFLSVVQVFLGHWQSVTVAKYQPAKFAAQEGLLETESAVPLFVLAILNDNQIFFSIGIPFLLSFLTWGDPNATIKGLDSFPSDETPSLLLTFYPFHFMVYLGGLLIMFCLIGTILFYRKKLFEEGFIQKWFFRIAPFTIPLPILSNELGWITTEVGRQPWVVQNVMRTSDAASTVVPLEQVLFSMFLFICIFALLFSIWILALKKIVQKGPEITQEVTS